jgi:hypothetical protein
MCHPEGDFEMAPIDSTIVQDRPMSLIVPSNDSALMAKAGEAANKHARRNAFEDIWSFVKMTEKRRNSSSDFAFWWCGMRVKALDEAISPRAAHGTKIQILI